MLDITKKYNEYQSVIQEVLNSTETPLTIINRSQIKEVVIFLKVVNCVYVQWKLQIRDAFIFLRNGSNKGLFDENLAQNIY